MTPRVEGVLLDLDGVLVTSWRPLPGAVEAVATLRSRGLPFRIATNTTQFGQEGLTAMLRDGGFDVRPEEVITASVATGNYLRSRHPGAKCFLLAGRDALADLHDIEFVEEGADVVVVGDAEDEFTFENLNHAFRMLLEGAKLVAMHRNLYWQTDAGPTLDVGAFIAGLEAASGVRAVVAGKPSPEFFLGVLESIGLPAERVVMVGDDVASDVQAAQDIGLTGVLVRTGKFRPGDEERIEHPTTVIDSIADLPALL